MANVSNGSIAPKTEAKHTHTHTEVEAQSCSLLDKPTIGGSMRQANLFRVNNIEHEREQITPNGGESSEMFVHVSELKIQAQLSKL